MPYIASNGELYDDEEMFYVEKNVEDDVEDMEIEDLMPVDDLIMVWERKLNM
jgi:hypothetical protein